MLVSLYNISLRLDKEDNMRYIVLDSTGHRVGRIFSSYKAAETFKIMCNRHDWRVITL